jgi:hypothetical protein
MKGLETRRFYAYATVALGVTTVLYLGLLGLAGRLGFPLDDAWIHQTYARNLVLYHQFAYVPGITSSGSTAPLWTMLLALAYLWGIEPLLWSYILGGLLLLALGLGVFRLGLRLFPTRAGWAALAGLSVLLEWHLVWAAFSGMETLMFACGVVWLLERYMCWEIDQNREEGINHRAFATPFALGVLGGVLVLVRPEGILLLALLLISGLLVRRRRSLRRTLSIAGDSTAGVGLLLIPFVVFNLLSSGSVFPNTFYAKQTEYAALLDLPLWVRLWRVLRPTWVGAQVVLVPGAVYAVVCLWRVNKTLPSQPGLLGYTRLVPVLWWALTLIVYALRLPVDYQHGRYEMPTIPVLMLFGVMGTLAWLRPHHARLPVRVVSRAIPWIVGLLLLGFLLLGARAYVNDVGIIDCEMVAVAQWLNENVPRDAVIAAHDIGAIGYFTRRPLLDMAGLITPEIIPFLRDESRMLDFVCAQQADVVVTFPSWYPQMVNDERLVLIYSTGCQLTVDQGGDSMAVYEILR